MRSLSSLGRAGLALAVVAGVAASSASAATNKTFLLSDHPDGAIAPPGYGLRFDHMFTTVFAGKGGATSFSFDHFGDTRMTVSEAGGVQTIRIKGTVWGGVVQGANSGFGLGAYALDFTYNKNVSGQGSGWVAGPNDATNTGSMTSLGNAEVAIGTVFSFADKIATDNKSFLFLQDEHRLAGHPEAGHGYWVGRGWFMNGATTSGGSQDFLFLGRPIPLPTPVGMAAVGLVGVFGVRRRRN